MRTTISETTTTIETGRPFPLPPDFRFGVVTSSYQIEGAVNEDGRGESIWDRFCRIPGAMDNGDTGDVACDHYHRWREDLELMAALRIEAYRFSIAWPRVQPDGRGPLNPKGLDFYRRLVEGLLERGIEPVATLYHWDLPQTLQDAGGWAARDTTERFAEYASAMAAHLGDLVPHWITHNEPWVTAFRGHAQGTKAPGLRDWPTALLVTHHLLLSHGLAVRALREGAREAKIGITLNPTHVRPASDSEADQAAAVRHDGYQNRWFLDPLMRGSYPEDMLDLYRDRFGELSGIDQDDLQVIAEPMDFLGVNYYFPDRVRAREDADPLRLEHAPPKPPTTAMGWEVDPSGLRDLLVRLHRDYGPIPIWITENGGAFNDAPTGEEPIPDPDRVRYLRGHLQALAEALEDGVDVRRYYVWSIVDNLEWERGYAKRFGLVFVDYETQRRVMKRSGLWYRDYIARARSAALDRQA